MDKTLKGEQEFKTFCEGNLNYSCHLKFSYIAKNLKHFVRGIKNFNYICRLQSSYMAIKSILEVIESSYDKVSANVMISVQKMGESGQMVF